MTVYCLVERDGAGVADASLRALSFARGLADGLASAADARLAAVVFGEHVFGEHVFGEFGEHVSGEQPEAGLAPFGVTDVIAVSGIDGYAPQAWARVLAGLLGDISGAAAVLAAATDRGNEVLAHLGAITGLPMAANCIAVSPAADGGYTLVRQRWAGLLLEEARLDAPIALLTVAADAVSAEPVTMAPDVSAGTPAVAAPVPAAPAVVLAAPAPGPAVPAVRRISPQVEAADLVVRAVETSSATGGASLATARVVVGGGRGVGSAEGFAPLEELAALLGGVVGVSRVVTSEGWRPHSMQVGQTGTKITPELYLACGISGAIQHIAGCSGAKHLIAINKDPSAPMMTRADYAVIGDLHEIVPALVQALRARTATELRR